MKLNYVSTPNLVNILLVENDETHIANIQRAFTENGIMNPLYVARDGFEALEMLKGEKKDIRVAQPRIVLLDINIPRMHGIDFLISLRRDPKLRSVSVFVMTDSDHERDKVAAYDLNVAGYILKPTSLEGLTNAMLVLSLYWQLCKIPCL